jgi:hypothetical protein
MAGKQNAKHRDFIDLCFFSPTFPSFPHKCQCSAQKNKAQRLYLCGLAKFSFGFQFEAGN